MTKAVLYGDNPSYIVCLYEGVEGDGVPPPCSNRTVLPLAEAEDEDFIDSNDEWLQEVEEV